MKTPSLKAPKFEDKFDVHDHDEFEVTHGDELCVVLGVVDSGSYGTRAQIVMQGTGKECADAANAMSEDVKDKYTHLLVMPISDLTNITNTPQ